MDYLTDKVKTLLFLFLIQWLVLFLLNKKKEMQIQEINLKPVDYFKIFNQSITQKFKNLFKLSKQLILLNKLLKLILL